MRKFFAFLMAMPFALSAQSLPSLPRAASVEVNDSALFLISIASPFRTRAVTMGILKALIVPAVVDSATGSTRAQKLTTARTLWGQSFDGTTNVSGTLTGVGDITGGASSMNVLAGTGNSRRLTLQTTTSAGATTTALRFNELQQSLHASGSTAVPGIAFLTDTTLGIYPSFTSTIGFAAGGTHFFSLKGATGAATLTGGAGSMILTSGTGNSRRLNVQTTTSSGTATDAIRFNELQQTLIGSGTVAGAPGLAFAADTMMGLWRDGATEMSWAIGGVRKLAINTSAPQISVNGSLQVGSGTVSNPSLALSNSNDGINHTPSGDTSYFVHSGVRGVNFTGGATSTIVGGAGNTIIQAGTGNSRTLTLQATSAAGATQTNQVLNNDGSTTMRADSASAVKRTLVLNNGASGANTGPSLQFQKTGTTLWEMEIGNPNDGNLTVRDVVGNTARITISNSNRYTTLADTLFITAPAEASTQSALCIGGGKMLQNAAATCTVSSARFKKNIVPFSSVRARSIIGAIHSSEYEEREGGRKAIGIIAEQADSADRRLASRDASGKITSTNYEEITSLLLTLVNDQQRQLDSLKTILRKKP